MVPKYLDFIAEDPDFTSEEKCVSDVICKECANNTFHLKYGDNEIFAICSVCGWKDRVYSG